VIDLALALGLAMAVPVIAVAYAGRVSRAGPHRESRIERAGASPLLGKAAMEMGYWAMRPVARLCIGLGLSANAVSWISLVLAAVAGAALAVGYFGVAAAVSLASSACDALDGMIARETGTASDSGEVLDAAIDRYAELFFFAGIVLHERSDPFAVVLTLAATAGAIMVSYSTAKAEALATPIPRGAMRRQERAVYLVIGVGLVPIVAAIGQRTGAPASVARVPLFLVLALVAVVGNVSAVRRLRALAMAVRKPTSLRTKPSNGANAIARDPHAAAGDAVR
jgi:CDP-diacylglycerol---glycerol-3-phosphate 3-phosphatidyltransferase